MVSSVGPGNPEERNRLFLDRQDDGDRGVTSRTEERCDQVLTRSRFLVED